MTASDEDELWRSIVANYGDRADLHDLNDLDDANTDATMPSAGDHVPAQPPADEDRFVPPVPPPLPRPDNKRLFAWAGVFGVPALLLVCLVAGIRLTPLVGYAMIAWFIGGFTYLVLLMPRGPRDPGDDGARL